MKIPEMIGKFNRKIQYFTSVLKDCSLSAALSDQGSPGLEAPAAALSVDDRAGLPVQRLLRTELKY